MTKLWLQKKIILFTLIAKLQLESLNRGHYSLICALKMNYFAVTKNIDCDSVQCVIAHRLHTTGGSVLPFHLFKTICKIILQYCAVICKHLLIFAGSFSLQQRYIYTSGSRHVGCQRTLLLLLPEGYFDFNAFLMLSSPFWSPKKRGGGAEG